MKRGILFFGITLILLSCSLQQTVSEHFEGKLIYSIESPGNIPDEKDSINYQVVYAKDSMLRIDSYTPIGKQIYIKHRSEEHTSELQSRPHLVCRLLLEKKKT